MSTAERTYQLLLCAYPRAFREAYGREMTLVFRDLQQEAGTGGIAFYAAMLWDVMQSAPKLWLQSARTRTNRNIQFEEGAMMPMAIMSIFVGVMEMATGLQEGWRGGMVNGDGQSLMAGSTSLVAGALLLAAGIAMLRRTPRAVALTQGAAIACLAVFPFDVLALPRLSIIATLLGTIFPIVLLIYLRWTQGRGSSAPMMA